MNKRQLFIVVLILCWISSFYLPWYFFPIISFLCGLLWSGRYVHMFWVPAIATSIIILTQLLFISFADKFRVAETIGSVLGGLHPIALITMTVFLFAIITGLGGLSGVFFRSLLWNKNTMELS